MSPAAPVDQRAGLHRLLGVAACNLTVILLALCSQATAGWTLIVLLWLNVVLYAAADITRRAILLAFLLSFFILLMGREIMIDFFRYEVRWDPPEQTAHLQACLALSLAGVLIGAWAMERWRGRRTWARPPGAHRGVSSVISLEVVRAVFVVVLGVAMGSVVLRAQYVLSQGYLAYYTEYSDLENGSGALYSLRRVELMAPMVLGIYLGMFPSRREVVKVLAAWSLYLLLSLGTGQRGLFVGGAALTVAYWTLRHRLDPTGGWRLGRAGRAAAIALVPVSVVSLAAIEMARGVGAVASDTAARNPVLQLFYGQGVSSSVIRHAYSYADLIPESLYTAEFLHSGFVARFFGYPVYHGNTVDHALHGGSFTHAFGYTLLGPAYLSGRGTGSSFIAELFYDFSYPGVLLGGAAYGALCVWSCSLTPDQPLRNGLRLVIIPNILWAPRGSATGFLTTWLSPSVLITLGVVLVLSLAVTHRRRLMRRASGPLRAPDGRGPEGSDGGPRRRAPALRRAPAG